MTVCTSCGHENSDRAKFCEECGAGLAPAESNREQRKAVTVLFCDVTGSTALGESTDPEALRALLARYFDRMKGIVEHHGGTVEKFIGDAVMAVFGVPRVHEDDALRAVRAALEMRDALPTLSLQARIGLTTGEVVTGTEERLATGDPVNVAARLEQAAQPGEILVGEETLLLVRESVDAEPVEPLELKGKAQPVRAYRLVSAHEPLRRARESRFVARLRELETLLGTWRGVRDDERCELLTVVGDPGVGKSRLAAEFLAGVEARVVRGRCLSYGEGITYWPVLEVLKQLDALPSDPVAAAPLRSLLRESDEGTSADEIAWAFRKLLEEQAPIVCVFDDIQWGEDTFLDLVEHMALLSTRASILLLCLARPELAEMRPHWPVALRLEPLGDVDVDGLIPESIPAGLRRRISRAAGGNPLFVTEMVAMAQESDGDVAVPPNLKALLAARLDQLEAPERSVLERGAVEGETFHRGSVQALSPGGGVTPQLASLVRKNLVRPDEANLPGDDAFRFRHLLIRDAAYDALPKAARAELHQSFARWLEGRGDGLVELEEILGYHLEQAALYKAQLGVPDTQVAELAGRHLAEAGRRAAWRGDSTAAAGLLERALTLLRPIRLDVALELELAAAHRKSRDSAAIADATADRARAAGDRGGEALARALAEHYRFSFEDVETLAATALPLLEDAEDHAGLVHLWWSLAFGVANTRWEFERMARAAENALHHAELAGRSRSGLFSFDMALVWGPRPADEALAALDAVLPRASSPRPLLHRAWLLAMLGRFDEAWQVGLDADARLKELGGFHSGEQLAEVATLAGDHAQAAAYLGDLCAWLESRGELAFLSTTAGRFGRALCAVGDYDQAETWANRGRELGDDSDIATQAWWRQALARVEAQSGLHAQAETHGREAVAISAPTDALNAQADGLSDLSEVLAAAGRTDEAAATLAQALDRYEGKKNLAMVAQVRPKLDALRAAVS